MGVSLDGLFFHLRVEIIVAHVLSLLRIDLSLERELIFARTEEVSGDNQIQNPSRARLSRA